MNNLLVNPSRKLKTSMRKNGYVHYWTVPVVEGGFAVSGKEAGKDFLEQKLSRWFNFDMNMGLFTMEHYTNGKIVHWHYLVDVEKYWGGRFIKDK